MTPSDLPPSEPTIVAVVPATPEPSPSDRAVRVTCEGCGCKLTGGGEVLKLGDEFKRFRKLDDKIETLISELDLANTRIRELEAENTALRAQTKKKGFFD